MSLLSFAKKIAGRQQAGKKTAVKVAPQSTKKEVAPAVVAAVEPKIVHAGGLGLVPLITEESVVMHGDRQTIAFRVRPTATKPVIRAAVADRFGVEPVSVRILQVRGKARRRGKSSGFSPAWKKAYVTISAGKTIDITA